MDRIIIIIVENNNHLIEILHLDFLITFVAITEFAANS